ncbi:MAG: cytochrome c [Bauldia sp.]
MTVARPKDGRMWIVLGSALISWALSGLAGVRLASAQERYTEANCRPVISGTRVLSTCKLLDSDSVERGMRLFRDRAKCQSCHGWDGQGALGESGPPSLIVTKLDREALVETIACGRIGRTMPNHLAGSWTQAFPCYGRMLTEDIGEAQMPPKPFGTLTMDEINDVANYIIGVYKGKRMTVANCTAFFSNRAPECDGVYEELIDYPH